jgi:hypothetical protein
MFPISDTIFRVDIGGTDITLDSLEAHLKAANQILRDSIGPALFLALWTQMGDRRPIFIKAPPPNFLPDPFKTGRIVAQPGYVYITGVRVEVDSKANITKLLQAFNIGLGESPSWVRGVSSRPEVSAPLVIRCSVKDVSLFSNHPGITYGSRHFEVYLSFKEGKDTATKLFHDGGAQAAKPFAPSTEAVQEFVPKETGLTRRLGALFKKLPPLLPPLPPKPSTTASSAAGDQEEEKAEPQPVLPSATSNSKPTSSTTSSTQSKVSDRFRVPLGPGPSYGHYPLGLCCSWARPVPRR